MLRSRSVSLRSVRNPASVVSVALVVTSLLVVSRASAGAPVVVAGPDGSARVTAIASELRARGFDVVIEGASSTSTAATTVSIGADGSVRVTAGRMRESFPASDGDIILARRVAEAIRAAEADAADQGEVTLPAPAVTPAPAPVPEALPPPPPASPPRASLLSPSRALAHRGAVLLSVDDALPLVAFGGAAPLATRRMLRIGDPSAGGDPSNTARTSAKPLSLDVAVAERLTIGGTILVQVGVASSILGGELRAGYVIPLGDDLALWPRIGVAHETTPDAGDWSQITRTDAVGEARLVWSVTRSWALTLGPSVALALQSTRYQFASTPPVTGGVSTAPTTVLYPENSPMRVSLAVGITGHLDEAGDDEHAMKATPPARVFLGVARALPLFRYRVDTAIAGKSRDGRRFEGPPARADGGTVDATSIVSQVPAFSVDVGIGGHISVGAAGSVGVVRFTQDSTRLIPPSSATSIVAWTLSPRIGWRAELSRSFALWPRIGLTYANASAGDTLAYSLAVDAEAFAVFSPVHGVGLVFGPSLGLPVVGARTLDPNDPAARRQEQAVFSVGLTGGLVVEVP